MDMELEAAKRLALGRILRMASRPTQPGDVEEYNRCRAIIMTDAPDWAYARPVWMGDMLAKGAAGD
jgi:hypothetical protein